VRYVDSDPYLYLRYINLISKNR